MANIELEFRAIVTESKYRHLMSFLAKSGTDLGEDDKDVYFFILPDKILKVVNNTSQKSAKIVLKLNSIGSGSDFEEIEIPIDQSEVEKSVLMFRSLGFTEIQQSFQRRHNFEYKGVELAIKFSKDWQYHVELEIVITDRELQPSAQATIRSVADELGLNIMSDGELKEFASKIDAEHRAMQAGAS